MCMMGSRGTCARPELICCDNSKERCSPGQCNSLPAGLCLRDYACVPRSATDCCGAAGDVAQRIPPEEKSMAGSAAQPGSGFDRAAVFDDRFGAGSAASTRDGAPASG